MTQSHWPGYGFALNVFGASQVFPMVARQIVVEALGIESITLLNATDRQPAVLLEYANVSGVLERGVQQCRASALTAIEQEDRR